MMRRRNIFGARRTTHRVFSEREWLLDAGDTPPPAAHVVTSRHGYTHHGIYLGDDKVVHYSGWSRGWRAGPVEEISLAEFARGRPIRVRPCANPRFNLDDVVARARSRLGENRCRILSNNCEHFCEWCLRGEQRSRRIDAWRAWPSRMLFATRARIARYVAASDSAVPGGAWA
jgi:hypothetical protein